MPIELRITQSEAGEVDVAIMTGCEGPSEDPVIGSLWHPPTGESSDAVEAILALARINPSDESSVCRELEKMFTAIFKFGLSLGATQTTISETISKSASSQKSRLIQVTVPEDETVISFESACGEAKSFLNAAEIGWRENCQDTSKYLPEMLYALKCLIQYLGWSRIYNAVEKVEQMMRQPYVPPGMKMEILG